MFRVICGQVIAVGLYTLAAEKTKIGIVAFMGALPISSVLGVLLFHEKMSWQRGLLIMLSFFGAALVVLDNPGDLAHFDVGALLALLSGIIFSIMLVTRRWHSDALNNYEITAAVVGLASLMTYGLSVILYHRWFIPAGHWTAQFTTIAISAGSLSVAVNFLGNYGFEHVSAVIAGNILMLEEVFGPLFGWIFYGELLTGRDIIGGLIILLSVVVMNRLARREHEPAQILAPPD